MLVVYLSFNFFSVVAFYSFLSEQVTDRCSGIVLKGYVLKINSGMSFEFCASGLCFRYVVWNSTLEWSSGNVLQNGFEPLFSRGILWSYSKISCGAV